MGGYPKSTLQIQFKSIQTKSQKVNFIFIDVSKLERKCTKTFKMGLEIFFYAFQIFYKKEAFPLEFF